MRRQLRQALVDQPIETIWATVGSRWEFALRRSWWDTWDAIGRQMWRFVIPGSLLAALLSIVGLSLKWDRSAVAVLLGTALTYPLIFIGAFCANALRHRRHPDQHEFWSVDSSGVTTVQGSPYLALSIRPKYLMTGGDYQCFCSVITPDGDRYRTRVGSPSVEYPRDFEGAPAVVVGVYQVRWLDQTGGKEKPLLAYDREVTKPMLESGPFAGFA